MSSEEEVVLWMKSLSGQTKSLSGQKRMAVFDSDDEQEGGLECAGEKSLKKACVKWAEKKNPLGSDAMQKRSQHQNGMMKGGQRDRKWVEEKVEKESS